MITIKAFTKSFGSKYGNIKKFEIGTPYSIEKDKEIKMCNIGFHASKNLDISQTTAYYALQSHPQYGIVELKNTQFSDSHANKVVARDMKVLCKLETVDEKLAWDKTGEWSSIYLYELLKSVKDINNNIGKDLKKLMDTVLDKVNNINILNIYVYMDAISYTKQFEQIGYDINKKFFEKAVKIISNIDAKLLDSKQIDSYVNILISTGNFNVKNINILLNIMKKIDDKEIIYDSIENLIEEMFRNKDRIKNDEFNKIKDILLEFSSSDDILKFLILSEILSYEVEIELDKTDEQDNKNLSKLVDKFISDLKDVKRVVRIYRTSSIIKSLDIDQNIKYKYFDTISDKVFAITDIRSITGLLYYCEFAKIKKFSYEKYLNKIFDRIIYGLEFYAKEYDDSLSGYYNGVFWKDISVLSYALIELMHLFKDKNIKQKIKTFINNKIVPVITNPDNKNIFTKSYSLIDNFLYFNHRFLTFNSFRKLVDYILENEFTYYYNDFTQFDDLISSISFKVAFSVKINEMKHRKYIFNKFLNMVFKTCSEDINSKYCDTYMQVLSNLYINIFSTDIESIDDESVQQFYKYVIRRFNSKKFFGLLEMYVRHHHDDKSKKIIANFIIKYTERIYNKATSDQKQLFISILNRLIHNIISDSIDDDTDFSYRILARLLSELIINYEVAKHAYLVSLMKSKKYNSDLHDKVTSDLISKHYNILD